MGSEDQQEESMTKEVEDLALFISKLQFGQDEILYKDYMIMEGEDNVEVEYHM